MRCSPERSAEQLWVELAERSPFTIGTVGVDVSVDELADVVLRRANGWRCDVVLMIDAGRAARVYIAGYLSTDRVMRKNRRDVVGWYEPHENIPRKRERIRDKILSDIERHFGNHRKAA